MYVYMVARGFSFLVISVSDRSIHDDMSHHCLLPLYSYKIFIMTHLMVWYAVCVC